MSRILLTQGDFGTYEITEVVADGSKGESRLIQTDRDYPGLAMSFGWYPRLASRTIRQHKKRCQCNSTDGTIDCSDCNTTASEYIQHAAAFLDAHLGDVVDDPGYFDQ